MVEKDTIRFNWAKILTEEFAVLGTNANSNLEANILYGFGFLYVEAENTLVVRFRCTYQERGNTLLTITTAAFFTLKEEDWNNIFDQETKVLHLPVNAAQHFASLLASTTRGILHAKLEGSIYAGFILPPMNVSEAIKDDVPVLAYDKQSDKS